MSIHLGTRPYILFDFDGTLADTKPTIVETATMVLAEWGMTPEEMGDVGRIVGPPFPAAWMDLFGASKEEALQLTENYRAIYRTKGAEAWPAFAGIPEMLAKLKEQGRHCGVVSSKLNELVQKGVTDNGLSNLLDPIMGRINDNDEGKDVGIKRALSYLGATPEESVFVGDRRYDVEAAAACGMDCIGVRFGNTAAPAELERAGAIAVVDTVEELYNLLTS